VDFHAALGEQVPAILLPLAGPDRLEQVHFPSIGAQRIIFKGLQVGFHDLMVKRGQVVLRQHGTPLNPAAWEAKPHTSRMSSSW